MRVREGTAEDLDAIRRIQRLAPEAAQWDPGGFQFLVAQVQDQVAAVLVWRTIAEGEAEVLNLAVDPAFRRRGIATAMLRALPGPLIFLEVRAGNRAAIALYRRSGFETVGHRSGYYENPTEDAVVMRLQS